MRLEVNRKDAGVFRSIGQTYRVFGDAQLRGNYRVVVTELAVVKNELTLTSTAQPLEDAFSLSLRNFFVEAREVCLPDTMPISMQDAAIYVGILFFLKVLLSEESRSLQCRRCVTNLHIVAVSSIKRKPRHVNHSFLLLDVLSDIFC